MHRDAHEPWANRSQNAPNPGGKIFHGGRPKPSHLVEKAMIESIPRHLERALEHTKVDDHAGPRVAFTAYDDLGTIGMAMNTPACLGVDAAPRQSVRRIETKLFC